METHRAIAENEVDNAILPSAWNNYAIILPVGMDI